MRAWTKSINKVGLCIILRRITGKCIRENVCLIKDFFQAPGLNVGRAHISRVDAYFSTHRAADQNSGRCRAESSRGERHKLSLALGKTSAHLRKRRECLPARLNNLLLTQRNFSPVRCRTDRDCKTSRSRPLSRRSSNKVD